MGNRSEINQNCPLRISLRSIWVRGQKGSRRVGVFFWAGAGRQGAMCSGTGGREVFLKQKLSLSLTCCHHQKSLSRWRRPEEDERRISAFSSPLIWLFLCQNRPFLRVQSSSQPFYTVVMEGNWKHLIQPAESCRSSNSVFISSVTSLLSFSLILWKWNCIDPRAEIGSSLAGGGTGM